jgi:cell division protein ZipA
MIESIFSLRFLLLIIGALIVAAIYVWGTRTNRRNTRIKYEPRRTTFEPKRRGHSPAATSESAELDFSDEDADWEEARLVERVVVAPRSDVKLEIPKITREGKDERVNAPTTRKSNQMELGFDSEHATQPKKSASGPEESIIALYVRPPTGHEFAGPAIIKAMNLVGLRFGAMEIFHHFGAGDLRTDAPLFSVANMVEPGHFKLQNIERFATPGLAMFLRLPAPLDGAVAFELFLNTGQRLAESLTGDLYSSPQKLLDSAAIEKMRKTAISFTYGR